MRKESFTREEERDLIERFQRGDESAFDLLVESYMDRIYSFAYRLSGKRDLAEDALQETFVKAWRSLGRFDSERWLRPWIFAIARNATIDLMRKSAPLPVSKLGPSGEDDLLDVPDETESVEDEFDRKALSGAVVEALEEITSDQRTAVLLHDTEGLTFEEIADLVGKPANTVKSHYRRAILTLRSILEGKG